MDDVDITLVDSEVEHGVRAMHGAKHRGHNKRGSLTTGEMVVDRKLFYQQLIEKRSQEHLDLVMQVAPIKQYMKDGVWLVPPEERMKGWERYDR